MTTKKTAAKDSPAMRDAKTAVDANLKALDASTPDVVIFRNPNKGAYRWRIGESVSEKQYIAREQAVRGALKANPGASITFEPKDPNPILVGRREPTGPRELDHIDYSMTEAERASGTPQLKRLIGPGGKRIARPMKASTKRPSGLDLAAKVLADAGEPLAANAIAERAIAAGWTTSGKTPHATLYAAIIREIASKGDAARFAKSDRGLFVAAGKGA